MTEHDGLVLRIERTFDAPAREVFDAWTSVYRPASTHASSGAAQ